MFRAASRKKTHKNKPKLTKSSFFLLSSSACIYYASSSGWIIWLHKKKTIKHTYPQRARESTCIDAVSGKRMPFLEVFPEDLLCHASALSSIAMTLRLKYFILHLTAVTVLIWKTFFLYL